MDGVACVILCQVEDFGIGLGVMLDVVFSDGGHVVEPMNQIRCKKRVGGIFCYVVSESAHLHEQSPGLKGARADDRFVGRVLATPMATVGCFR